MLISYNLDCGFGKFQDCGSADHVYRDIVPLNASYFQKIHCAHFFKLSRVEDAVIRYLNRRPTAGLDAPGNT